MGTPEKDEGPCHIRLSANIVLPGVRHCVFKCTFHNPWERVSCTNWPMSLYWNGSEIQYHMGLRVCLMYKVCLGIGRDSGVDTKYRRCSVPSTTGIQPKVGCE